MGILSRLWSYVSDGPFQLPPPEYCHFHNIVIPSARGTTEIDHLIVSRFGVFVVEIKDYSGWILGNATDRFWAVVHFKRRYRFQNPLHQNFGHLKALESFLGVAPRFLHGVVVFRGSFQFKTQVPPGVLLHRYRSWIASHQVAVFSDAAVAAMIATLETGGRRGWIAGIEHARSVRARYASDSECPKCGGALQLRTSKRGTQTGSLFIGCSGYPACRYTKPAG
jgi:hypothetical protein